MSDKIKIMTISDAPYIMRDDGGIQPLLSGVAIQTRYMIEGLLEKYPDKYEFVSLGGARKHQNYQPVTPTGDAEQWTVFPVDNFGNPQQIRSALKSQKPDILWFMTDPRFYEWLWNMEDEVRPHCPMVYYNIWDNYPYPKFNKIYYDSTDVLVPISKLTEDVNQTVAPETDNFWIPHTTDFTKFRPRPNNEIQQLKDQEFWSKMKNKFVFFFNGRNCRRKQTASLIKWFGEFLDDVGHDKAALLMHTEPDDENGPNLKRCAADFGLNNGEVIFSTQKKPPEDLALIYNAVDCTVLLSDAEGWGIPIMESLACGTPVIATKTGGIQDQICDEDGNTFGIGLEPSSKAVVGTQRVPYIYEDRLAGDDVKNALNRMYNASQAQRRKWGEDGKKFVRDNYNMKKYVNNWDEVLSWTHDKYGSWPNKQYDRWTIEEI